MTVYIIHENSAWLPPFQKAFEALQLPFVEWNLSETHGYSLTKEPDQNAIYFNRISPSSHTRNHRFSCEITAQVLDYLSLHSCRIINDQRSLSLELSKVKQYVELTKSHIRVPRTAFVASATSLSQNETPTTKVKFIETLKTTTRENFFDQLTQQWTPFVSKHNRAGKGLGVHLFTNEKQLEDQFESLTNNNKNNDDEEFSVDGIYLLQEYIKSPEQVINRAEFIGYKLMYIIEVDTRQGFQLCPSDACRKTADAKLIKQSADEIKHGFNIRSPESFTENEKRVIQQLENFLEERQIEVAGIEWVDDGTNIYVYDVNCNTNYNVAAETRFFGDMYGTIKLGEYFQKQLRKD
jgi:glutathione synthase/RimK-type ligase-like ATP-grasp enzyme